MSSIFENDETRATLLAAEDRANILHYRRSFTGAWQTTFWDGVRNFQARNFMPEMQRGDKDLFYHSNADSRR